MMGTSLGWFAVLTLLIQVVAGRPSFGTQNGWDEDDSTNAGELFGNRLMQRFLEDMFKTSSNSESPVHEASELAMKNFLRGFIISSSQKGASPVMKSEHSFSITSPSEQGSESAVKMSENGIKITSAQSSQDMSEDCDCGCADVSEDKPSSPGAGNLETNEIIKRIPSGAHDFDQTSLSNQKSLREINIENVMKSFAELMRNFPAVDDKNSLMNAEKGSPHPLARIIMRVVLTRRPLNRSENNSEENTKYKISSRQFSQQKNELVNSDLMKTNNNRSPRPFARIIMRVSVPKKVENMQDNNNQNIIQGKASNEQTSTDEHSTKGKNIGDHSSAPTGRIIIRVLKSNQSNRQASPLQFFGQDPALTLEKLYPITQKATQNENSKDDKNQHFNELEPVQDELKDRNPAESALSNFPEVLNEIMKFDHQIKGDVNRFLDNFASQEPSSSGSYPSRELKNSISSSQKYGDIENNVINI